MCSFFAPTYMCTYAINLQHVPESFWCRKLFEMVLACALQPWRAGVSVGDVQEGQQMPKQVRTSAQECMPSKNEP